MRRLFLLIVVLLLSVLASAQSDGPRLRLEIEGKGSVLIRLYPDKAPKAVANIVKLAKDGFYDGLRFHRADRTPRPYLVQVGDPQSRSGDLDAAGMGSKGTGSRIPYEETGLTNVVGAVGLARLGQDRDSGDSQFYILLGAQRFLDGNYTVFGQVVDGLDVVKRIEKGDRITKATITGS
jgi:cyclophilin family peptidyl-prolyl cis-trans isomerase